MNAPRRFRFSLRFLIAWMLLIGLFTFESLQHYGENTVEFYSDRIDRETADYHVERVIHQGWPFEVNTYSLGLGDAGFFDTKLPESVISTYPELAPQQHPLNLLCNLAIFGVASFIVCASAGYLGARAFKMPGGKT